MVIVVTVNALSNKHWKFSYNYMKRTYVWSDVNHRKDKSILGRFKITISRGRIHGTQTFALSEIVTRSLEMPQVTPQRVYLNVIRIGNSLVLVFRGQDEARWCFQVAALGKITALIEGSDMTLDLFVAYWRRIACLTKWEPIVQSKLAELLVIAKNSVSNISKK